MFVWSEEDEWVTARDQSEDQKTKSMNIQAEIEDKELMSVKEESLHMNVWF